MQKFLYTLSTVAMARSCSDVSAIHYVLVVCFLDDDMFSHNNGSAERGRITDDDFMFRVRQMATPGETLLCVIALFYII